MEKINTRKEYIVHTYTDDSKHKNGVGSSISWSGVAILKALERVKELNCMQIKNSSTVYTLSRITLDSLKNSQNHNYLIEEIIWKLRSLEVDK